MTEKQLDLNQRIQIPQDVLFREIDGEAVILNLDNEAYHGLDEVGTRMWIVLQESETIAEAYAQLLSEYKVDAEQLRTDLIDLLSDLREHGLITIEAL